MNIDWMLILKLAITLIVGFICYKLTDIIFRRAVRKNHLHTRYFKNILKGIIVVCALGFIASLFEETKNALSVILASSGLLVAVLGFAAQESLSNIINGLFISIFKPFEIGDRVMLTGKNITGWIEDITLRHTVIKTVMNTRLIVPNSVMNKEIIENSHYTDMRSANLLDVWISYDSDVVLAKELMADIIIRHPLVIDIRTDKTLPQVNVMLRELGDSGVCLRATVWTETLDDSFTACSDIRLELKNTFKKNGIEIPYKHLKIVE